MAGATATAPLQAKAVDSGGVAAPRPAALRPADRSGATPAYLRPPAKNADPHASPAAASKLAKPNGKQQAAKKAAHMGQAAPAAAARKHGQAQSPAAAGRKAKGGMARREGGESTANDNGPPEPLPLVAGGSHRLAAHAFEPRLESLALAMPRVLTARPAQAPSPTEAADPAVRRYLRAFSDAADVAATLHRQFVATAEAGLATARAAAERRADAAQSALDQDLDALGLGLTEARGALATDTQTALLLIAGRAGFARSAVNDAAGAALGGLAAAAAKVRNDLVPARKELADIVNANQGRAKQLDEAGKAAAIKFDAMAATPDGPDFYPFPIDRIPAAINELTVKAVPPRARDRSAFYTAEAALQVTAMAGPLAELQQGGAKALAEFEAMLAKAAVVGPSAVRHARDAALAQVDAGAAAIANALGRAAHAAEASLVRQHNIARTQLIEAGEARARGEHLAAEARATRDHNAGIAAARGPPQAVRALDAGLGNESARAPPQFAASVIRASDALSLRANASATDQRGHLARDGESSRIELDGQAAAATARLASTTDGLRRPIAAAAAQSGAAIGEQADKGSDGWLALAPPVRRAMNGFLPPLQLEFDLKLVTMWVALGAASASFDAAFRGDPQPKTNDGKKPPTDGKPGPTLKPVEFEREAGVARSKPKEDPTMTRLVEKTKGIVRTDLATRASNLDDALGIIGHTNVDKVMENLRGLTVYRGPALSWYWLFETSFRGSLEWRIKEGLQKVFTLGSTDRENTASALNYLQGNSKAGAFHEMQAAVIWWNDNDRLKAAHEELDPATAAELAQMQGIAEIRADLDPAAGELFDIYAKVNKDNATKQAAAGGALLMKREIDKAQGGEDEASDDETRRAISKASDAAGMSAIAGYDKDLGKIGDAIAGAEQEKRSGEAWQATVTAFGEREDVMKSTAGTKVVAADGKAYDGPGAALYAYAGRERTYHHVSTDEDGNITAEWDTTHTASAKQKLWIEKALKHGVHSDEAAAALGALMQDRKDPDKKDREELETAFHDKKIDAREGETPTEEELAQRRKDAEKRLQHIHQLQADYENQMDGGKRDAAAVGKEWDSWATRTADGDKAKAAYLKGITTKWDSDPAAAWFYAVEGAGTDVDLLKRTTRRLSRDQIKKYSQDYNTAHPEGPSIKARLGIHGEHATRLRDFITGDFLPEVSGDDANDLTVLFMGVPATPLQMLETARMTSKLQHDQAGWAGKLLASDEFDRLDHNIDNLARNAGMSRDELMNNFGPDGEFRTRNPFAGQMNNAGNFDTKGQFVPRTPGTSKVDFELACTTAQLSAENYKAATDRIANYVSTAIVVAAAIAATILTGGGASIFIPMLVTAAGGLIGIGANIAIKGGRYGYEEMGKDFAMTLIQTATAGLAAGAGVALKGGMPALRMVAGAMKVSQQAIRAAAATEALVAAGVVLEETAAQAATRATIASLGKDLSLLQHVGIGVGTSAFAGGASAMLDGEAWREGKWLKGIAHGVGRSAIGGGVGALATAGMSGLVNRGFAGGRSMLGLSQLAAGERANAIVSGITRVAGSSAGGFAQSFAETAYGAAFQDRHATFDELVSDAGRAAAQNAFQSLGEHGFEEIADRRPAGRKPGSAAERPVDREIGTHEIAANDNVAPRAPQAPANDNQRPAIARSTDEPDPQRPQARHGTSAAEAEAAPAPRKPAAHTSGPGDDEVTGVHSRPAGTGGAQPAEFVLDHWDPGSVIKSSIDPHSEAIALTNYHELILEQGQHETGLYWNPTTGEYVVVQGDPRTVPHDLLDGGPENWLLRAHYHPQEANEPTVAKWRQVPSGRNGDLSGVEYEARKLGQKVTARIHYYVDGQLTYTDYSFDPHAAKPYSIERPDPRGGPPRSVSYADLDSYGRAFEKKFGWSPNLPDEPLPGPGHAPATAMPPTAGPGQPQLLPDRFEFHHGTTLEGSAAIEAQGIIANRGKVSADDFGAAFYVAIEREAAQTYASTRSGAKHEPTAGAVLSFRLSREEMGVIVDVRPGGKDRAAWDQFMSEPTLKGKMLELAEENGWPTTREQELNANGVEKRAAFFEEFLASQRLNDADAIIGDLGGDRTGGFGKGHQIAIRSQRLANLLTEQLPGRVAARAAESPLPEKPQPGIPWRTGRSLDEAAATKPIEPATSKPRAAKRDATPEPDAAAPAAEGDGGVVAPAERDRRQGRSKLDPAAALAARSSREAVEARVRDLKNEGAMASWASRSAEEGREVLKAQRPPKPDAVEPILRGLRQTTDPEERLAELQDLLANKDHDPKVQTYLEWQEKAWRFQVGNEIAAERAVTAPTQAEQTRQTNLREAERTERSANKDIKALMRKNGPNYGDALDATSDRIFGEPRWSEMQATRAEAGLPPLKLNPDHLIPLDEIANMGELKPLLEMHQQADDRIKGEIRLALEGLGDVRDNLWPMESRANQHMKGAHSWHHISFEEAAKFGYTSDDVRLMRRQEDRMRGEIKARIAQLLRHFENRMGGAPAGPLPPPRPLPPLPPPPPGG